MGQKLKFCARGLFKVNARPGAITVKGQFPQYVNRENVPPAAKGEPMTHPATKTPFECDADSETGRILLARMGAIPRNPRRQKDPPLWPADEATAEVCGLPYQPIEFKDGAWVPKAAAPSTKPAPTKGADKKVTD